MRQMIFISHANPEDNEFAQWLALRLAREGYAVWCDLTKLLGGEDFWKNADQAIRDRTIKFLYVLSRTSNVKDGPLQELAVAKSVRKKNGSLGDFIIPLRIDDLPHEDIEIEIFRLNAIDFSRSWALGLKPLLEKLVKDDVPRDSRFSPEAVASWWNTQFDPGQIVRREPQPYVSNWFPLKSLPKTIHVHEVSGVKEAQHDGPLDVNFPAYRFKGYVVTFATPRNLAGKPGISLTGGRGVRMRTMDFLDASDRRIHLVRRDTRTVVKRLLRLAWARMVDERKLPTYEFSSRVRALYLPKGFAENDKASFQGMDGKPHRRSLVGYKTMGSSMPQSTYKRYWHFGIHAEPSVYPVVSFAIKPHVVFSRDGSNITGTNAQQHRARRGQCRHWWNDDWRDRILATMAWLGGEAGVIELPVSPSVSLELETSPVGFLGPVSYRDQDAGESLEDREEETHEYADTEDSDEGGK